MKAQKLYAGLDSELDKETDGAFEENCDKRIELPVS